MTVKKDANDDGKHKNKRQENNKSSTSTNSSSSNNNNNNNNNRDSENKKEQEEDRDWRRTAADGAFSSAQNRPRPISSAPPPRAWKTSKATSIAYKNQ